MTAVESQVEQIEDSKRVNFFHDYLLYAAAAVRWAATLVLGDTRQEHAGAMYRVICICKIGNSAQCVCDERGICENLGNMREKSKQP